MKRPKRSQTAAELAVFFEEKAVLPPEKADSMFVRHLQCKESLALAQCLCQAIDRSPHRAASQTMALASELMPPLA